LKNISPKGTFVTYFSIAWPWYFTSWPRKGDKIILCLCPMDH